MKDETVKKLTDSVFKNAEAINNLRAEYVEKTLEDDEFDRKIDRLVSNFNEIYEV